MRLTLQEAARELRRSKAFVEVLLEQGTIRGRKVDGKWTVDSADLVAYKQRLGGPPGPGPLLPPFPEDDLSR